MLPGSTVPIPLRWATPPHWARQVLREPLTLLNDHAHLEKKATLNALELLHRWPTPKTRPAVTLPQGATTQVPQDMPSRWVAVLTGIARDEVEHLAIVTRLLARRGGRLSRSHRNPYASALRQLVRRGTGPFELIDRLMVSALIELRSCERFEVLARDGEDSELSKLYRGLSASEEGHYKVFIGLAQDHGQSEEVEVRWDQMLDAEARIMANQKPGYGMHSGVD